MLKKLLSLLTDTATYGVGGMLANLVGFLLLPLYTRYLSPTDFGLLTLLQVIVAVFEPIANLGVANALFRRLNQAQDEAERELVAGTAALSSLVTSLAFLGLSVAFASQVSNVVLGRSTSSDVLFVKLTLINAALTAIATIPQFTLRAQRRVRMQAGLNLFYVVGTAAFSVPLVVVFNWGVAGAVWGNLIAQSLQLVLLFWATRRSISLKFSWATWQRMARYGLPLVPYRLQALGLLMLAQYIVGHRLGLDQAGLFGVASRFVVPISAVVGAIASAWAPFKFQIHREDPDPARFFRSIAVYFFMLVSTLWVGVSLAGPEVLRFMTGPRFHAAALLIPVLALTPVIRGMYSMLTTGFELGDDTRALPAVSGAGLVVAATGYFLAPVYGAVGPAIATALAWTLMTFLLNRLAQRHFRVDHDWLTLAQTAVLAAVVCLVSVAIRPLPLLERLAIEVLCGLTFPLCLLAILYRSETEGDRVRRALPRVLGRLRARS